ncbi:YybH family protein [Algoriphagus hitonicola]|uniref:DUF4440 domain-containing protein n=1 Tax=Algoriphagus hitonicola TaxID=435880 RepID=A0A1I2Q8D2_9BACT|nr:DUF4440 domain-containing protein [Algoriphagus hitonicola]SFG21881.1 conserved hypothetical protein [Algoriphagus hitonicola]
MKNLPLQVIAWIILLSIPFAFQGCNEKTEVVPEETPSEPVFDLDTAKKEIQEANQNFMSLVAAGDSVGLANAYTADAKFMAPGGPSVQGRANIQSAMHGMIQSGITAVDLRLENVYGTADLIAEEGELTLFVGEQAVSTEKYIVLWKKEDGQWKLFRDIFNSNSPAE